MPNAFNAHDYTTKGNRSRVQWYRERFTLPSAAGAAGWRIRFESVNVRADVWLNGRRLAATWRVPPLRAGRGGNPSRGRTSWWCGWTDARARTTSRPPVAAGAGGTTAASCAEVYLAQGATARPGRSAGHGHPRPAGAGPVQRARVRNATRRALTADAALEVSGPNGFSLSLPVSGGDVAAGRLGRLEGSFQIPNAALWSPASPSLYLLKVRLPGGQVTEIHFGVRQWSKAADGRPLLNGKPLTLRGASFHEDTLAHGAALTPADESTIADELVALGANFTRQHYPPSPALLEAFDRLGIVFWEQIPVWRLRGSDLTSRPLNRVILDRLRQTVLRDRNHASVMAWSVENEVVRPGAQESRFLTPGEERGEEPRPHPLLRARSDREPGRHAAVVLLEARRAGHQRVRGLVRRRPARRRAPRARRGARAAAGGGAVRYRVRRRGQPRRARHDEGHLRLPGAVARPAADGDGPDALPRRCDCLAAARLRGAAGLERRATRARRPRSAGRDCST